MKTKRTLLPSKKHTKVIMVSVVVVEHPQRKSSLCTYYTRRLHQEVVVEVRKIVAPPLEEIKEKK
jgi:hypothetical protein